MAGIKSKVQHSTTDELPLPLIGESEGVKAARFAYEAAIGRRAPVLVAAEPGCRPAAIAVALHRRTQPSGPFVTVDCGADEPLAAEARLLGAPGRRAGVDDLEVVSPDSAIAQAAGGTLFLDNIDELPAGNQRRLARVMRDAEVRLAHSRRSTAARFRLIAATTRDIEGEAQEGRFREDLVRRLISCRITVPPLRRRLADILAITRRLAADDGNPPVEFTPQALRVLSSLPWTGNIDELAELLARVAGQPQPVTAEVVLATLPARGHFARVDLTASLREARRHFERDYIAAVLEQHRWSMSDAARALGIERANLYRKTRQLGITRGAREPWTVQR